ncbi:endonuclease [Polaribacter sp.]|nr:endonuclease [Polaribacter sp.]MDA9093011.1 endonuclease [Polaribacter sp.]MDB4009689.1 endonuclease [Polaribacter sp.]MDB4181609.1 endonuclease [Polaribacter sp.]
MKNIFLIVAILSASLSGFSQESYYNDVDLTLTGLALKNALNEKIVNTHTNFLQYTPDVWIASKITDANPENPDEVILIYGWEDGSDNDSTNDRTRDNTLQDNGSNGNFVWNREHVYPQSLGTPAITTSTIPGQDAHSLRPVDKPTNSSRGNKRFAEGSGNSGESNGGWYPGDEWKGDVARMMMYMYIRYDDICLPTNVGIGDSSLTEDDMIDLFLKWNVEDPVSDFERNRNTYHENTTDNSAAQGNRNPLIDNPYLATRIWGGDSAEDTWGIYTSSDTVAPTQPMDVVASNETTTTIDINWTASTDNVEVTGYNIYVDDVLTGQTANVNYQITGLAPSTSYAIQVEARDLINNKSDKSTVLNAATTSDTTAPSVPTNITATNISGTAFKANWDAATDDTAVTEYRVFVDGVFEASTTDLDYTITGLTVSTTYQVSVSAKDAANNESAQSESLSVTTTDGQSNGINELFISEYVEPAGGTQKAIEIVNLTSSAISLEGYSIMKQSNGAGEWIDELALNSGTVQSITTGDVFVILNSGATAQELIDNADLFHPDSSPMNFNGNDPIGFFKDGVLIDIVGTFGNSGNFAQNITLRRKEDILSPNTTFDINEWDSYAANTFDGIGSHSATLSVPENNLENFQVYPNPNNGNTLYFNTTKEIQINVYSILGKLIKNETVTIEKKNIDISTLSNGIYLLKITSENKSITKKLIRR